MHRDVNYLTRHRKFISISAKHSYLLYDQKMTSNLFKRSDYVKILE